MNKEEFKLWCSQHELLPQQAAKVLGLAQAQVYRLLNEKTENSPTEHIALHCEVINRLPSSKALNLITERLLSPHERLSLLRDNFDLRGWLNAYHIDVSDTKTVLGKAASTIYPILTGKTPSLGLVLLCKAIDTLGHDEAHLFVVRKMMLNKGMHD